LVYIRQKYRQGIFCRVFQKNQRLFDHVPVVDEVQHKQGRDPGFTTGYGDFEQYLQMVRPVYLSRFDQIVGNRRKNLRDEKNPECRKYPRQNDCRVRPYQIYFFKYDIIRHQHDLNGHHHQYNHKVKDNVFQRKFELRETVPSQTGYEYLPRHDRRGNKHGVPEFHQICGIYQKNIDISLKRKFVGNEMHIYFCIVAVAFYYFIFAHERVCKNEKHGKNYGDCNQYQSDIDDYVNDFFVRSHNSTSPAFFLNLKSSKINMNITTKIIIAPTAKRR